MRTFLSADFFDRPATKVARELLGKYLVRSFPGRGGRRGRAVALMITEVEAYDGPRDRASHASRGRTPRNAPMFGKAGRFYVYFTYGMHWLANVVTGPEGYPAAVLLRAGVSRDPATGEERPLRGPALLARFLGIGKAHCGKPAGRRTGLWFEDRGAKIPPRAIIARRRTGVDYAGPYWAGRKYNFSAAPERISKSRVKPR